MRRIIYYTLNGKTTSYKEAMQYGLVQTEFEDITEPMSIPEGDRNLALKSVIAGVTVAR